MSVLYLADLDGTLLKSDLTLGAYTAETVNGLFARGMRFTYATARSFQTAAPLVRALKLRVPVIVNNGVFTADPKTGEVYGGALFSKGESGEIFACFRRAGLFPIVYSMIGGRQRFSFCRRESSTAQRRFLLTRLPDPREREIEDEGEALEGDVFYFSCIGDRARLRPVYEELKDTYRCYFAPDIYTGDMWLEITERSASKASAARALKETLGCEKLVCFGDAENDIPLFEAADECYAVENAAPALKAVATGIVPSNDGEGVARWLEAHVRL